MGRGAPRAGDPTVLDLGHVRPGNGDRPSIRACLPLQRSQSVMADRIPYRRESERRTELVQQVAGDRGYGCAPLHDVGRLVHDRLGHEEVRQGLGAFAGIPLVEDALQVGAQQPVVIGLRRSPAGLVVVGHGMPPRGVEPWGQSNFTRFSAGSGPPGNCARRLPSASGPRSMPKKPSRSISVPTSAFASASSPE